MTSGVDKKSTHIPQNEVARMAAVRRYEILDTPKDGSFERITAIAARLFDVPIAIISIVDHDRIWFKSHYGVEANEIGRDPGLCASAILRDEPYIIPDTKLDVHALTNPLVSGTLGLRFYAGVPLHTHDGFNLGTLCVIDKEPREVTAQQIEDLKDLASVVMDQLELRLSARKSLSAKDALLHELNHRIGNSLQFVADFLQLEGLHTDPVVTNQLNSSAERVARIGRVHHRLSQSGERETMDIQPYLEELCGDIASSLSFDSKGYRLIVTVESTELPASTITVLGLIVNELVTNSAKHAFSESSSGTITVDLKQSDFGYILSITDDGKRAMRPHESPRTGVGTKLIRSLVEQIRGKIETGPTT
ncbi:MAG TPA: histidine kinase dimerization/phosphoacceptor domain -containing protein, partial [Pirellula sp.]|nr:histidine kinase dimerization/phosphoacceptor domain -containing protein [Pirellula sp.]